MTLGQIVEAVQELPLGTSPRVIVGHGAKAMSVVGASIDVVEITLNVCGMHVSAELYEPCGKRQDMPRVDDCELAPLAKALAALGGTEPVVFLGWGSAATRYLLRLGGRPRPTNGAMLQVGDVRFHCFDVQCGQCGVSVPDGEKFCGEVCSSRARVKQGGFTLIELLIVLTIVGLLAFAVVGAVLAGGFAEEGVRDYMSAMHPHERYTVACAGWRWSRRCDVATEEGKVYALTCGPWTGCVESRGVFQVGQ